MDSPSASISLQHNDKLENGEAFLPGFRFHPTDEELVGFYLRRKLHNHQTNFYNLIPDLDLYSHEPWDLPGLAAVGPAEMEWFFFVSFPSRVRNDGRPNRITPSGYWKATGTEKPVCKHPHDYQVLGWKKTLVFYEGRAPGGHKRDWVMNEYRFYQSGNEHEKEEDIRVCRVYKKSSLARSFDRRPIIHVERKLHTDHPFEYQTSISSLIETNSPQQQCTSLGQQSSHTIKEDVGKPYSPPKTEMGVESEELRLHNE